MGIYKVEFKESVHADFIYVELLADSKADAVIHVVNSFHVWCVSSVVRTDK